MKDKLRAKIDEHIEKILQKSEISFEDYQILSSELYKIEMQEKTKELEEANNKRAEALKSSLEAIIK